MRNSLIVFAILPVLAVAQNSVIEKFQNQPNLKHAGISIAFTDVKQDSIIWQSKQQSVVPASVTKLFTTAAALKILGSDTQFQTLLTFDSTQRRITIVGMGDPTLASRYLNKNNKPDLTLLDNWVSQIQTADVGPIKYIGYDDSHFGNEVVPDGYSWGDIGNYYGCGSRSLNFFDNTLYLEFASRANSGQAASLRRTWPEDKNLLFHNEVKGANIRSDQAYIYGGPNHSARFGRGQIPIKQTSFEVKASHPNPANLLCELLAQKVAKSQNSPCECHPKVKFNMGSDTLLIHRSPKLSEIIKITNQVSNNLYAETLLRHIGVALKNDGSIGISAKALQTYLSDIGINTAGLNLKDGSGLSRSNAINASNLTSLLNEVYRQDSSQIFWNSLAVAGQSGTFKSFANRIGLANNVRGKSGSMGGVKCYAGFFKTKTGSLISFAVLVNNFSGSSQTVKNQIEQLLQSACNRL